MIRIIYEVNTLEVLNVRIIYEVNTLEVFNVYGIVND